MKRIEELKLIKISEEVTNGINELIQNKNKLSKLLPEYIEGSNNEFNIKNFISDKIDTNDWYYSEGLVNKDNTLVYENVMDDEIDLIKNGDSDCTVQELYKEYNMAKSNIENWINKINK